MHKIGIWFGKVRNKPGSSPKRIGYGEVQCRDCQADHIKQSYNRLQNLSIGIRKNYTNMS